MVRFSYEGSSERNLKMIITFDLVNTSNSDGRTSLQDESRSGRPNTANNDWNTARVDELIKVDRRVKRKEISLKLDILKTNIYESVYDKLGYRKVSARWVPKMSDEHKRQRVEISQILLHRCQQEGDETVE
ncbi:histone-lysine N-methyltransferase SETMAR [Plakobranchus ocellatus]|uniref:Histone-lysine N-methyltransferase SETMAR n=1 Tax=Plakobranchus ocellatus TaxID=259542 RepID=A0AAV4DSX8_9GAST|nr:histone-lysine N-methyltransferase SETMAR [Plakobranchus ocellatus]